MRRGGGLLPLVGHEALRDRIRGALLRGRMPQSLLFHGPEGVGKQRLALWTAALLQCEDPERGPCGACRACRLAGSLQHPDIHWHFPLASPGGAAHKRREKLEEARLEELARRREHPLEPAPREGPSGIYLAAVAEIRDQAARRPATGRRAVFVIGEADRMVSQAASPEAANAFLKLLEEPPEYVTAILTSARPGALLPTIRSRTLAVRVRPLEDAEVEAFLREQAGVDAGEAKRVARRAQGSIGRALRIAAGLERDEREVAERILAAALSGRRAEAFRVGAALSGMRARGELEAALEALEEMVRDLASGAAGHPELAFDPAAGGGNGAGRARAGGARRRGGEREPAGDRGHADAGPHARAAPAARRGARRGRRARSEAAGVTREPRRPTHVDAEGRVRMVDVSEKPVTRRRAVAEGRIRMRKETLEALLAGRVEKGEALAVARLAAISGAKRTADLVPLCHPLPLDAVEVEIVAEPELPGLRLLVTATAEARTGVEMEALTGAAAGLLALYDMCKGLERGIVIGPVRLLEKSGGRSGTWRADATGEA